MTMFDSEKIELIEEMLKDFWICERITEDSAVAMLNAIATVVDFEKKGKK
jgi:hypothetical protein